VSWLLLIMRLCVLLAPYNATPCPFPRREPTKARHPGPDRPPAHRPHLRRARPHDSGPDGLAQLLPRVPCVRPYPRLPLPARVCALHSVAVRHAPHTIPDLTDWRSYCHVFRVFDPILDSRSQLASAPYTPSPSVTLHARFRT
jgi:hypothetical protein